LLAVSPLIVLIVSFSAQVVSAIVALWLFKISRHNKAWLLVSLAITLMAIRRSITIVNIWQVPPDRVMWPEIVALLISLLLVFGLLSLVPYFKSIERSRKTTLESLSLLDATLESINEGILVVDTKGQIVKEYSQSIGNKTNNEAEYEAVILALQKIKHLFGKHKTRDLNIEVKIDSELVARQLSGKYKIVEEKLFPLFIKVWNLKMDFGNIVFTEIPREKNREADKLANQAMDKRITKSMF